MRLDQTKLAIPLLLAVSWCLSWPVVAQEPASKVSKPTASKTPGKATLDRSGKARKGKASYYGKKFHGRKMADGTPMNPNSNVAASKTLSLGTKAKVTNLENGKSEVVEIRDRGPYVDGRIVDLSPKVADKLDITERGVAPVEVKPIAMPQADGTVKPGSAGLEDGGGKMDVKCNCAIGEVGRVMNGVPGMV